ncbi:M10 family metallopeptidase [Microvirga pudoricolor]|uniref:M10 family metallopeptidase n=1 Tax=Microvirga pudoricolor TaxID=2778729 RepID=UPI00194DDC20|nr:M10 family metallopeptidase [Microvirga pudoricolor]MBM6595822.1 M10 family metallopeptidase C-terminal domain-containing protein [Microvirga pudoricolor]
MCYACLDSQAQSGFWASPVQDSALSGHGLGLFTASTGTGAYAAMGAFASAAPIWDSVTSWFGDRVERVYDTISENISAVPLEAFSAIASNFPNVPVANAKYSIPYTADADVKALFSGSQWSNATVTYSFPDSRSDFHWLNPSAAGYAPLSFENEQAIRHVLEGYSPLSGGPRMTLMSVEGFTNLNLDYVGRDDANIQVSGYVPGDLINRNHAYYPGIPLLGGDTWLTMGSSTSAAPGARANYYVLHELGHALGLKHPHEAGGNLPAMSALHDSPEYTVMSYAASFDKPQTFMAYDIAALQALYGADFTTNAGNTVYKWDPQTGETLVNGVGQGLPYDNTIFLTLWDGGGNDTYDMSNYGSNAVIDLTPGGHSQFSFAQLASIDNGSFFVRGNVYNALQYNDDPRSLIENAIGGSGNDRITGNAAANTLTGNGGNDTLEGNGGNDLLYGGAGADRLIGGSGNHDYAMYDRSSTGLVVSLASPSMNTGEAAGDTYSGVEGIHGSRYNDSLFGDHMANALYGNAGNDFLSGAGGDDALYGDLGNDSLIGGTGSDLLMGGDGNDYLDMDAGSSAGADTLDGGYGDDILIGDGVGSLLIGGWGRDTYHIRPWAKTTIADFAAGPDDYEKIIVYKSVFADYAALMSTAYQSGGNTVIAKGEFSLTLTGVGKTALHLNDFVFI